MWSGGVGGGGRVERVSVVFLSDHLASPTLGYSRSGSHPVGDAKRSVVFLSCPLVKKRAVFGSFLY